MVDTQTLSIVVTGIGIIGAIVYYTLTLRSANRTRRTQLFMQIFQELNSKESWDMWVELMNAEVADYDDFMRRYDSAVNPDSLSKRSHIWYGYHCIGLLLRDGVISIDLVNDLVGLIAILLWRKWRDIIEEIRVKQGFPQYFSGFEYLYNELVRYQGEHPEKATIIP
jgi:hypothetical protein